MATAGDQINRALRLLGVLAEGETPSASTTADCLTALNQMLDSWSTERLAVYTTQSQSFTWPANTTSRTLGASGNFVGNRPVMLDPATYFTYNGVSYPIQIVNREQYNSIVLKTSTSPIPQVLFIDMTYPNATMYLYPVPSTDLTFYFVSVLELSQPANSSTTLSFPPGYLRAFAYNLACEIAPEFGIEPPPQVKRVAIASKRDLKRINNPDDVMGMPAGILPFLTGGNIYNGWQQ